MRFLKFNPKKLNYILSLTADGRVRSSVPGYGYTIKANVKVPAGMVVTTPAGAVISGGKSFSVGNAMLEDGTKVTDFDTFSQWVNTSGKQTASRYTISEADGSSTQEGDGFSQEYIDESLSPGVSQIGSEEFSGFVTNVVKELGLFTNPNNLKRDLEQYNFLYTYYAVQADENEMDVNLVIDAFNGYLETRFSESFVDGKLAKVLFEGESDASTNIIFKEGSYSATHYDLITALVSGDSAALHPLLFRMFGVNYRANISGDASKQLIDELMTYESHANITEEQRSRIRSGIQQVEALSLDSYKKSLAKQLGLTDDELNEALRTYRHSKPGSSKVSYPFTEQGLVSDKFKSKIEPIDIARHLLKFKTERDLKLKGMDATEAASIADKVVDAIKSYEEDEVKVWNEDTKSWEIHKGGFPLADYVESHADSVGTNYAEIVSIRKNQDVKRKIDEARIALLTKQLVVGEDGSSSSILQLLSQTDDIARRGGAQDILKALEEIEEPSNEIDKTVLEKTKEILRAYQNKAPKIPPSVAIDLEAPNFEEAFEIYYGMKDRVDNFSKVCSPFKAAYVNKVISSLLFFSDTRLIDEGLVSESELLAASSSIAVLGWGENNLIRETNFAFIQEDFTQEQKEDLRKIDEIKNISNDEKESLKHRYVAVQFSKDTRNYTLDFVESVDCILESVYELPKNSVVGLDEPRATKLRDQIDETFKENTSQEELNALYLAGERLKSGKEDKEQIFDDLLEELGIPEGKTRENLKKFLVSTSKKSKKTTEDSTIGYYAESPFYALLAKKLESEGGSIDFEEVKGMKILRIKDSNGQVTHEFIDHGKSSGMCDMAIAVFKDGRLEGLVSSELKMYVSGRPRKASFKDLSGFSEIIKYLRDREGSVSIPMAGFQQNNILGTREQGNLKSTFTSSKGSLKIKKGSEGLISHPER